MFEEGYESIDKLREDAYLNKMIDEESYDM